MRVGQGQNEGMKTILSELDRMATKGQLGKGKFFEPVVKTIWRRSCLDGSSRCFPFDITSLLLADQVAFKPVECPIECSV